MSRGHADHDMHELAGVLRLGLLRPTADGCVAAGGSETRAAHCPHVSEHRAGHHKHHEQGAHEAHQAAEEGDSCRSDSAQFFVSIVVQGKRSSGTPCMVSAAALQLLRWHSCSCTIALQQVLAGAAASKGPHCMQ